MSTIMKRANAKSDVWKHFIKENATSAQCVLCTKVLKHGGNTTNLHNHYKNVHKIHSGTNLSPTGSILPKQPRMADADSMNENELNEGTQSTIILSNSAVKKQRRTMPLMDNSSDSNIDDPTPCNSEYSDAVFSENSLPVETSLHSLQNLKFKAKRKVKNFIIF